MGEVEDICYAQCKAEDHANDSRPGVILSVLSIGCLAVAKDVLFGVAQRSSMLRYQITMLNTPNHIIDRA